MKNYKICDKKAPRYRGSKYRYNLINENLWLQYKKAHKSDISFEEYKRIVTAISNKIIQLTVEERDGVLLPEHMGKTRLILYRPIEKIVNVDAARNYGIDANYLMFNTDGLQGKIEWSFRGVNYYTKNKKFFGFKGHRNFAVKASNAFKNNSERYVIIDIEATIRARQIKKLLKDELNNKGGTEPHQST
jgi:hypothetical protein